METKFNEVQLFEKIDDSYLKSTSIFRNHNEKMNTPIEFKKIGDLICTIDSEHPNEANYNRIKGLNKNNILSASEAIRLYQKKGIAMPAFELLMTDLDYKTTEFLSSQNCFCFANFQRLYMDLTSYQKKIRETSAQNYFKAESLVKENSQLKQVYFESVHKGRTLITKEVSEEEISDFEEIFEKSQGQFKSYKMKAFKSYMTTVDGVVAGIASTYIYDNVGYLLEDFTKPAFRGLGIHQALINARIYHARLLGLEYVYTDVEMRSIGHHNMEKCGLYNLITKSIWLRL